MRKIIDIERLRKEVKGWKRAAHKSALGCADADSETRKFFEGKELAYGFVIVLIDSLQQEQPEADLDFSMFAKEIDAVYNLPKEITENTKENPLNWEYAIARHFYELGLKARKEQ